MNVRRLAAPPDFLRNTKGLGKKTDGAMPETRDETQTESTDRYRRSRGEAKSGNAFHRRRNYRRGAEDRKSWNKVDRLNDIRRLKELQGGSSACRCFLWRRCVPLCELGYDDLSLSLGFIHAVIGKYLFFIKYCLSQCCIVWNFV